MISAEPGKLVVTVVFEDLNGKVAFGHPTDDGFSEVHVDSKVLKNDPAARAAGFEALIKQVAIQAARAVDPREHTPGQRTAADRCASWARST